MSVRRWKRRDPKTGETRDCWMVDVDYEHPDGRRERLRKVSPVQTRRGAEEYERQLRHDLLMGRYGIRKEVPTFEEWWHGRYWNEWVIGRKNKPSSMESKRSTYEHHLKAAFGHKRLDEIGVGEVARFRAGLIQKQLTDKTVNNILTILSKPLRYAVDVEVIMKAPKVGLLRVEANEIDAWELHEYARILAAARRTDPTGYAAVLLAGEAGLRVGEVKALRWRVDVDLIAKTIIVNQQMRRGIVGTPKGRTRRTVPMTAALFDALRALDTVREGYVIRNLAGHARTTRTRSRTCPTRSADSPACRSAAGTRCATRSGPTRPSSA
jgi:integrase